MLFTLRHSPLHCDFPTLLHTLSPNDDLLLIQNGVVAALEGSTSLQLMLAASKDVFALENDIEARGLMSYISNKIQVISYTGFVHLAVKQQSHIAW